MPVARHAHRGAPRSPHSSRPPSQMTDETTVVDAGDPQPWLVEAYGLSGMDRDQRIRPSPPCIGKASNLGHGFEIAGRQLIDRVTANCGDLSSPSGRVVSQRDRFDPAFDARVQGHPLICVDAEFTCGTDHERVAHRHTLRTRVEPPDTLGLPRGQVAPQHFRPAVVVHRRRQDESTPALLKIQNAIDLCCGNTELEPLVPQLLETGRFDANTLRRNKPLTPTRQRLSRIDDGPRIHATDGNRLARTRAPAASPANLNGFRSLPLAHPEVR
ncbi:hypothetical protein SAMN04244553_3816 [Nocardia amikacinitolerans]|uniref:Uncharacterized protein n=1 Tax=Nocardia amikacinitolerans TaxID=756689 RepID=A0A285LSB4_9NOCA|nr:hypothetical protein [Nocardia amikacinitolerans]SNY86251.1 hypothetical protein SAMN04244553_3816 [Nocardia amikacinitolerans]